MENQHYTKDTSMLKKFPEAAKLPVDRAYEVSDDPAGGLAHEDHHVRAVSAQILIRYDFPPSILNVYNGVRHETIRERALELIAIEEGPKYRRTIRGL